MRSPCRLGQAYGTANGFLHVRQPRVVEQVQHEILEAPITVYNFEVADFHTYYVGDSGVLVHNMCAKKRDIQQINQVARQNNMDSETRRAFGNYVEILKWDLPNNRDFSFKELQEIAKEFLGIQ